MWDYGSSKDQEANPRGFLADPRLEQHPSAAGRDVSGAGGDLSTLKRFGGNSVNISRFPTVTRHLATRLRLAVQTRQVCLTDVYLQSDSTCKPAWSIPLRAHQIAMWIHCNVDPLQCGSKVASLAVGSRRWKLLFGLWNVASLV